MKLLIKTIKKILILLLIIFIILLSYIPKKVYARFDIPTVDAGGGSNNTMTVEQGRQNIANFALNFQSQHSQDCDYDGNWQYQIDPETKRGMIAQKRGDTYYSQDTEGKTYSFDCVGWITFAINRATKMDCNDAYGSGFVTTSGIKDKRFQSVPISEIIPGDILIVTGRTPCSNICWKWTGC